MPKRKNPTASDQEEEKDEEPRATTPADEETDQDMDDSGPENLSADDYEPLVGTNFFDPTQEDKYVTWAKKLQVKYRELRGMLRDEKIVLPQDIPGQGRFKAVLRMAGYADDGDIPDRMIEDCDTNEEIRQVEDYLLHIEKIAQDEQQQREQQKQGGRPKKRAVRGGPRAPVGHRLAAPSEDKIYMHIAKDFQEERVRRGFVPVKIYTSLATVLYNQLREEFKLYNEGREWALNVPGAIRPVAAATKMYTDITANLSKLPPNLKILVENMANYINFRDNEGEKVDSNYIEKTFAQLLGTTAASRAHVYSNLKTAFDLRYRYIVDHAKITKAVQEINQAKAGIAAPMNPDDFGNARVFDNFWHHQGGADDWYKYIQREIAKPGNTANFLTLANIKKWFATNVYPQWTKMFGAKQFNKIKLIGQFAPHFYKGKPTPAQSTFMTLFARHANSVRPYQDWLNDHGYKRRGRGGYTHPGMAPPPAPPAVRARRPAHRQRDSEAWGKEDYNPETDSGMSEPETDQEERMRRRVPSPPIPSASGTESERDSEDIAFARRARDSDDEPIRPGPRRRKPRGRPKPKPKPPPVTLSGLSSSSSRSSSPARILPPTPGSSYSRGSSAEPESDDSEPLVNKFPFLGRIGKKGARPATDRGPTRKFKIPKARSKDDMDLRDRDKRKKKAKRDARDSLDDLSDNPKGKKRRKGTPGGDSSDSDSRFEDKLNKTLQQWGTTAAASFNRYYRLNKEGAFKPGDMEFLRRFKILLAQPDVLQKYNDWKAHRSKSATPSPSPEPLDPDRPRPPPVTGSVSPQYEPTSNKPLKRKKPRPKAPSPPPPPVRPPVRRSPPPLPIPSPVVTEDSLSGLGSSSRSQRSRSRSELSETSARAQLEAQQKRIDELTRLAINRVEELDKLQEETTAAMAALTRKHKLARKRRHKSRSSSDRSKEEELMKKIDSDFKDKNERLRHITKEKKRARHEIDRLRNSGSAHLSSTPPAPILSRSRSLSLPYTSRESSRERSPSYHPSATSSAATSRERSLSGYAPDRSSLSRESSGFSSYHPSQMSTSRSRSSSPEELDVTQAFEPPVPPSRRSRSRTPELDVTQAFEQPRLPIPSGTDTDVRWI